MNLILQPRFGGHPLTFDVDPETLELSGPDADRVRVLMLAALRAGAVLIDPYPTSVLITDPLRDRSQFAAVLAEGYALPANLLAWLDEGEDEPEDLDDDGDDMPGVVF